VLSQLKWLLHPVPVPLQLQLQLQLLLLLLLLPPLPPRLALKANV